MESNQLLKSSFDDIIFEQRNKEYGAYQLRQIYAKHVNIALAIAITGMVLLLLSPFIIEMLSPEEEIIELPERTITITELDAPPPLDETKPPPPPVNVPPPPEKVIKYVPPKIVKEEVEEEPPTIEEIKETKTSSFDQEGEVNINYEPPKEQVIIEKKEEKVFEYVDKFPTFPGGMGKYEEYLQKNINYPPIARDNNISGTVYLSMVVASDGSISDVKVLKDIGGGCGAEAKRVVESMPNWVPGEMNGNPVKVRTSIRVKFTLR